MQRIILTTLTSIMLCGTAIAQDRGHGARDDVAPLTTNGMLDRKDGMSSELFMAYWRDVHGPLAARITGMHQYWQHHLATPDPSLLPESVRAAVETAVGEADQLEGIAETTFTQEAVRQGLGSVPATGQLFVDEQNFFRATYLHGSMTGNTYTHLDRIEDPTPQGKGDLYRAQLLFRATDGADVAAFRVHLIDAIAAPLAAREEAVKVRSHLFEVYDASGWDTPGVDNDRTQAQAFDGQIELAFASREDAAAALQDIDLALGNTSLIAGIHVYPVKAVYSLIYDGRPTLVGLRGYPVAATIEAVGATNQRTLPVLRTLHGDDAKEPAH